jgi:nucleotidyltransferase substrate binding protein (TIGR01987 family)
MDKLSQKHAQILRALETLRIALEYFKKIEEKQKPELGYDEEYRIHRDSVTQRFEYSTDILWKYLKLYLESLGLSPDIKAPKEAVREACEAKVITEQEAERIFDMIKSRNLTSHLYLEEIAEQLIGAIPQHYKLMMEVVARMQPKL